MQMFTPTSWREILSRLETSRKYFVAKNIYDKRHFRPEREIQYRGGTLLRLPQIFPRYNIREEISHAGVFPVFREIGRTSWKDSEANRSRLLSSAFVAPCVAKVAERSARGCLLRFSRTTRDRKRALQVVIIRGPGAETHTHGAITSNGRSLSLPLGVKLNFGYTGCAKCLSRALRWSAFWSRSRAR